MNFLERIFAALDQAGDAVLVRQGDHATTARELLRLAAGARARLRERGLRRGDRVALLGGNSAPWIALDLAVMAEGLLTVPLYARQAPAELTAMIEDCDPALVLCANAALRDALPDAPPRLLFEEMLRPGDPGPPEALAARDPVRIVYTSGTSGEAKGALLTRANLDFMLPRTEERLDRLMRGASGPERVFHYLPFCFAGSWILLLTCLRRAARLTLSEDLQALGEEMRAADPHYVLHVPLVLERIRARIEAALPRFRLLRRVLAPFVRRRLGPRLRAFISGSAPLAEETQRFFMMLGLPVLQVYGLTETTAICTMDEPERPVPGRVGTAVEGCEMRLGEGDEILVRGPNVFPGYWGRPPHEGWLHTGDRGEVDAGGHWKVLGRAKNLLVLASGHNVAPEPLEEAILRHLPGVRQAVVLGDGRPHLAAILTGDVDRATAASVLEQLGANRPHYERIRAFHLHPQPFTNEEGLITANGKLRRAVIAERFRAEIEELYR